jgi:hypothetical protein
MGIKFVNNFETTISAGINNSVTTIPITSATGFPSLGAGDYAYCSLQKDSPLTLEIVKVTAVSGTNLTVVRAQDGTSAAAFASGDAFELRVTAGGLNDIFYTHPNHSGDVTSSGDGATTIANDAVSYAKMQDVSATDRVLGRDSAGAGVVEEISPASLRTMINVEDGATADQSNAEIETAYDAQVAVATQSEAEAGSSTAVKRFTPQRIGQAIAALASSGLTLDTTVKTASFTAVAGNMYLCNTTGGAFNMTLPTSPSAGDTIGIIDYLGTFDTNNLTLVQASSKKIFRANANGTVDTKNWSTSIKFIDDTVGWLPAGD